jgi:sec-independent protein translocase protein TatA
MPEIGIPELLIILVIVLIIFGPGRLAGAGTALGQAIREFRQGVRDEKKEDDSR